MRSVVNAQDSLKLKGVEACRKVRQVKQGERLDIIAVEELKDPLLWRKIAELNDIDDPLNFPGPDDVGKIIIISD
jgi:nucleoid-associated protein YgaU